MAIVNVASADTITLLSTVAEITGTTTVNTINGPKDGQLVKLWPAGAFAFGSAGNVVASAAVRIVDEPVFLFCRNGVLTEVGRRPSITDFTNAPHNHTNAANGGQLTSAAFAAGDKTGSGDVVLAESPTIDDPTITTRVRLPGPVFIYSGSGTPEGNVPAPVGSFYLRTDGAAGTIAYTKNSGSGDTGWGALS